MAKISLLRCQKCPPAQSGPIGRPEEPAASMSSISHRAKPSRGAVGRHLVSIPPPNTRPVLIAPIHAYVVGPIPSLRDPCHPPAPLFPHLHPQRSRLAQASQPPHPLQDQAWGACCPAGTSACPACPPGTWLTMTTTSSPRGVVWGMQRGCTRRGQTGGMSRAEKRGKGGGKDQRPSPGEETYSWRR